MTHLFFSQALLPTGWARNVRVAVTAGRIAALTEDAPPQPGDNRYAVGLAGLPNLHSHGFQRGMSGLCETRGPGQDDFWTWREVMYGFLDSMTPDDVEAITAQAYVEMLEGGFTRVGEFHYLHNDPLGQPYADPAELTNRIAAAASAAGIRLTLLPVFYAHGAFGGAPATPGQRRFVLDLDVYARVLEAARRHGDAGVAPHSLRAVTPDELAALCSLAATGPIHIHVAEQVREVKECLAWSGATPVRWLLDNAPVDARWCLVHATHMLPDEAARLARTGAVTGLCPVTEANLGDGIFDGPGWLAVGGRYGVGTDSNVAISAPLELQQLEASQRLARRARNVMATAAGQSTGRALFDAASVGGAAALGAELPALSPGAPADLVALDDTHPSLLHKRGDAILDSWIFGGAHSAIDSVWVGGRRLVRHGQHVAREQIAARFSATLRRLLER